MKASLYTHTRKFIRFNLEKNEIGSFILEDNTIFRKIRESLGLFVRINTKAVGSYQGNWFVHIIAYYKE